MEPGDKAFLMQAVGWINANEPKIRRIYNFQKGWEVWAQCELADFLATRDQSNIVLRETGVYEGKTWRADLYYQDVASHNKRHVIEIKCKSYDKSDTEFQSDADADTNKITDQLKSNKEVTKWCLAFVWPNTVMSTDWHQATGVTDPNGPQLRYRRFSS